MYLRGELPETHLNHSINEWRLLGRDLRGHHTLLLHSCLRQLNGNQPTVHGVLRFVRGDGSSSTGTENNAFTFSNFGGSDRTDIILELLELLAQEESGVRAMRQSRSRGWGISAHSTERCLGKVCGQTIGVTEICLGGIVEGRTERARESGSGGSRMQRGLGRMGHRADARES